MKPETSQKLCTFLGFANLGCYLVNHDPLNLYIGIAMSIWVLLVELMRNINV